MNPKTVDEVISDFKGRRAAIVKALTHDAYEFYQLCLLNLPPSNLCLYGYPDQHWDVNLPPNSELPRPRLGINSDTQSMNRDDWLSMVSLHSEAWLHAVASYFAAKLKFDRTERKQMFDEIIEFPSITPDLIGNTSTSKRARITDRSLPEDLLILILARLPVRDLVKYRLVSKSFRALIDDPEFASTHLTTYKNNSEESNLLILETRWRSRTREEAVVRRSDTFQKVMIPNYREGRCNIPQLGYINGLMLLNPYSQSDSVQLTLWNPSIDKYLDVPCSLFSNIKESNIRFWLGHDASCNDYKVIAIVYPEPKIPYLPCQEVDPGFIHVYMLSTNFWTTNKFCVHPPPAWIRGPHVFVNGAIHWINLGPKVQYVSGCEVGNSNLVVFDVCKEVFSYMDYPNDTNIDGRQISDKCPIVLGRVLGMFFTYSDDYHHVWVMEEYGVANSWTKRYTFNFHMDHPRYFKSNGELLFRDKKSVRSYDARKELQREVAKTVFVDDSHYKIFRYVESLVLLERYK